MSKFEKTSLLLMVATLMPAAWFGILWLAWSPKTPTEVFWASIAFGIVSAPAAWGTALSAMSDIKDLWSK